MTSREMEILIDFIRKHDIFLVKAYAVEVLSSVLTNPNVLRDMKEPTIIALVETLLDVIKLQLAETRPEARIKRSHVCSDAFRCLTALLNSLSMRTKTEAILPKVVLRLVQKKVLDFALKFLEQQQKSHEDDKESVLGGEPEDFAKQSSEIDGVKHRAHHSLPRENGRRDHLGLRQILLVFERVSCTPLGALYVETKASELLENIPNEVLQEARLVLSQVCTRHFAEAKLTAACIQIRPKAHTSRSRSKIGASSSRPHSRSEEEGRGHIALTTWKEAEDKLQDLNTKINEECLQLITRTNQLQDVKTEPPRNAALVVAELREQARQLIDDQIDQGQFDEKSRAEIKAELKRIEKQKIDEQMLDLLQDEGFVMTTSARSLRLLEQSIPKADEKTKSSGRFFKYVLLSRPLRSLIRCFKADPTDDSSLSLRKFAVQREAGVLLGTLVSMSHEEFKKEIGVVVSIFRTRTIRATEEDIVPYSLFGCLSLLTTTASTNSKLNLIYTHHHLHDFAFVLLLLCCPQTDRSRRTERLALFTAVVKFLERLLDSSTLAASQLANRVYELDGNAHQRSTVQTSKRTPNLYVSQFFGNDGEEPDGAVMEIGPIIRFLNSFGKVESTFHICILSILVRIADVEFLRALQPLFTVLVSTVNGLKLLVEADFVSSLRNRIFQEDLPKQGVLLSIIATILRSCARVSSPNDESEPTKVPGSDGDGKSQKLSILEKFKRRFSRKPVEELVSFDLSKTDLQALVDARLFDGPKLHATVDHVKRVIGKSNIGWKAAKQWFWDLLDFSRERSDPVSVLVTQLQLNALAVLEAITLSNTAVTNLHELILEGDVRSLFQVISRAFQELSPQQQHKPWKAHSILAVEYTTSILYRMTKFHLKLSAYRTLFSV
eukprot:c20463_g2_i1.p1 GENE.c20463_g2_i1~~c20463_g2_i1.p1  ORF type:complete len:945 (-),score=190.23 c20463_g2_i1:1906-4578(-)